MDMLRIFNLKVWGRKS